MACPGHAVLGRVIPKTLRTTNLQSITTKCKQRLSLGRSLGRPCPRRHALGMLSLAGSVPAPCERRTYTGKHNPSIFMQWGWELSQQWSSGEFRQIKACNQKGQKGSTGRLGIWTLFWTFFEMDKSCVPVANLAASAKKRYWLCGKIPTVFGFAVIISTVGSHQVSAYFINNSSRLSLASVAWMKPLRIQYLPWEPQTLIFRGYDPYIEGLKPSFFMVLGSKGI